MISTKLENLVDKVVYSFGENHAGEDEIVVTASDSHLWSRAPEASLNHGLLLHLNQSHLYRDFDLNLIQTIYYAAEIRSGGDPVSS